MKNTLLLFLLLTVSQLKAQFFQQKSIEASIGLGYTQVDENISMYGDGFYLQGEYVLKVYSWFELRPYAGIIFAKAESEKTAPNDPVYKSVTNAFLIGGKTRLKAPIPYFAPYFEIGIGASLGSFEVYTPLRNIEKEGIILHIPFSIGVALGRKNNIDIEFTYYNHSSIKQYAGAFAVGILIPLKS